MNMINRDNILNIVNMFLQFVVYKLPFIIISYIMYPNVIQQKDGLLVSYKTNWESKTVYTVLLPVKTNQMINFVSATGYKKGEITEEINLVSRFKNDLGPNLDFYKRLVTPNDYGVDSVKIVITRPFDLDEDEEIVLNFESNSPIVIE